MTNCCGINAYQTKWINQHLLKKMIFKIKIHIKFQNTLNIKEYYNKHCDEKHLYIEMP